MLFVVAGGTFRSPCFSSMIDLKFYSLLEALAIVCLVKRYCRMSDWSCSYNTWIAAKRKVVVLLILCWVSDIVSGEDVMMNR